MNKRLLIVSWFYYPASSVGARRIFNFGKYLKELGHEVTILTVEEQHYESIDAQLAESIDDVRVERTRAIYLRVPPRSKTEGWRDAFIRRSKFVLSCGLDAIAFPDQYAGWIRPAIRRAHELHRESPFDVVVSSGHPWSCFIIGDEVASRHAIPHVMDYRDPWTAIIEPARNRRPAPRSERLERALIGRASRVLVNTREALDLFARTFPEAVGKVNLVRNGFDPETYAAIKSRLQDPETPATDSKFRLTHTGKYYASRRLAPLIDAVAELAQNGEVDADSFEVLSYGTFQSEDRRVLQRHGLEGFFRECDFIPYAESLLALARSSMNLLVIGPEHGAMIPAKFYDYLMVERPIFAIGPEGSEVQRIIAANRYGLYADIGDVRDIAAKLRQAVRTMADPSGWGPLAAPREFDVRDQVQQLSKWIGR